MAGTRALAPPNMERVNTTPTVAPTPHPSPLPRALVLQEIVDVISHYKQKACAEYGVSIPANLIDL